MVREVCIIVVYFLIVLGNKFDYGVEVIVFIFFNFVFNSVKVMVIFGCVVIRFIIWYIYVFRFIFLIISNCILKLVFVRRCLFEFLDLLL